MAGGALRNSYSALYSHRNFCNLWSAIVACIATPTETLMRRIIKTSLFALLLLPSIVRAEPATLTIEPFYADLTIQPGQASVQSSVRLTNSSDVARTFNVATADLGGL